MGYKEQYDKAVKEKVTKSLSAKFIEWKDKGQQIIGRLLARNAVASQLGGGTYFHYLFQTDEGLVKISLGRATDNDAGQLMGKDGVYSVTFQGQEKISGGRKINKFDIVEIEAPVESAVGGASDVPF